MEKDWSAFQYIPNLTLAQMAQGCLDDQGGDGVLQCLVCEKRMLSVEEFLSHVHGQEHKQKYANEREVRDAADIAGNSDGRTFLEMLDDEIAEVN